MTSIIKKMILPVVLVFLFTGYASAQNAVKMTSSDGTETIFLLSGHPSVSLADNILTITTDTNNASLEFNGNYTFQFCDYTPDNTGVDAIQKDLPVFKVSSDILEGFNLNSGANVNIYDLSGKKITVATADANGYVSIDVARFPNGVYVVKAKANNFKFYKR